MSLSSRRPRPRVIPIGVALVLAAACAAPVGGWDVEQIEARHPAIRSIPGQRLGDLTPYPALVEGRVVLVACRFADDAGPVTVRPEGLGWPEAWATAAITAVDLANDALVLVAADPEGAAAAGPVIAVRSIDAVDVEGPAGLADTLAECDVAPTGDAAAPVRGRLEAAQIRIRRRIETNAGLVQEARAEEWVGALLHELAHASGFQGHAAFGESLVVLEQSRLRRLGRRALDGEPVAAPNLRALYRLPPGTMLGEAPLDASARQQVDRALAEVAARVARLGEPLGPFAIAGDRQARLVWRWPGGSELVLLFPDWAGALRWGRSVEVRKGRAIRR